MSVKFTRLDKTANTETIFNAEDAVKAMREDFDGLGKVGLLNTFIAICDGAIYQSLKIAYYIKPHR